MLKGKMQIDIYLTLLNIEDSWNKAAESVPFLYS